MKQTKIILISILAGIMLFFFSVLLSGLNGKNPFARRNGDEWGYEPKLVLEYEKEAAGISGLNLLYDKNSLDIIFLESDSENLVIREYAWRELKERERTEVREKNGVLTLESRRRGGASGFISFSWNNNGGYVEVYLPKNWGGNLKAQTLSGDIVGEMDLKLEESAIFAAGSTSGEIELPFLKAGEVQISTTSGDISVDLVKGKGAFSSTSGEITLFTETGDCDISTVSGDIQVESLNGNFRLSTNSGDIRIGGVIGSGKASTTSGEIGLQFAELTGDLTISSTSGNVDLAWPVDTAVRFEAGTTSGEINTFFDGSLSFNKKGNQASGSYGAGTSHMVEISTTSGDVDVRKE